jgi:serine/threonine protein kinase
MSPRQTIAHYRITSKLGEGGRGAVYRATDTKLNRKVAIKVLTPGFAQDADRMARFEREAQVLASLNHPNIAAIYGIEEGAIVMELVDGADLKGPVPVETAIDYARQLATALEAAHEKGIVHRDLKPANIKVTPDGVLKVLDFGLAKATGQGSPVSGGVTQSPTLSLQMTQAGMILGTAAYMAPEQARGKPVDKRADIWAFGAVLYELLTGGTLFGGGETISDSLAAVITKEPDWTALPANTPLRVRRLLQRCLRKDPKQRLRDIGDARLALDEPEETLAKPSSVRRPWLSVCATKVRNGARVGSQI